MFYQKIDEYLGRSQFFEKYQNELLKESQTLFSGLNKSAKALLVSRALQQTGKNIIFLTIDDKMAEEYADDLEIFNGRNRVWFLPDFEVLPFEERSPHYTIRATRIEALTAAVSEQKNIFCLSLRSFLRYITPHNVFSKNIIKLENGRDHNPDQLVSSLVGMGYEVQYQVSKVGEVAKRGGIIDVFSPNCEKPVRIDFWGDEITSIRQFSLNTQKSEPKELGEVTLIPSREFSIHNIDTNEKMWEKVHEKGLYEGIELDISLLMPEREIFLEYFNSDDFMLFIDEFQYYNSYLEEITEETNELWAKARTKSKKRILPEPDALFASAHKFYKIIKGSPVYFLSQTEIESEYIKKTIVSPCKSQTIFNNNLELLEASISAWDKEGYAVFIQSENLAQSKRMRELLQKEGLNVNYTIGVLHRGFVIDEAKITVLTDHEIFNRSKKKRYQAKYTQEEALIDYESMKPGDYIVHINHGIGIFDGLIPLEIDGNKLECLVIRYAENDKVYVPTYQLRMVTRYVAEEGVTPVVHRLGSKQWDLAKERAKKQIELVADDLVKLYAERTVRKGIAFDEDNIWQKEMEDAFIFEDTPDQRRSTEEIKRDMESHAPMERLLCGDVGFGKTEVAIRAAFKAVMSGWQVAVLVPTTLLAEQHYNVFKDRLAQYPVRIAMFSRFRSPHEIKKDVVGLVTGDVDIAIGTHRLLSTDVQFKRPGLLIIDEEHRFGVQHKEKLRKMKSNMDTLYMSATPIPRTLNMAMSKLKEISLIQTSPKARLPIRTIVIPFDNDVIKESINREIERGGQVFFIHNRVESIQSIADDLRKIVPQARIRVGHGQLPERELEAIMLDFSENKFDILVATTIIESGIDIANANTIIINRADTFGLAQLYQIRGRVGRSNRRAYAYFIIPPRMTDIARKRLETLTEYDSLGAGYQIAMRDLELRGAGTVLGNKQSGVINTIGFNFYNHLLETAVQNIEEKNPNGIWDDDKLEDKRNVKIEADYYFPSNFISNEKERLTIYRRLLAFENEGQFDELIQELSDRFGKIPETAARTINYYKLRHVTHKANVHAFQVKGNFVIIEFDSRNLPPKEKITKLLKEFSYPASFETVGNLKIKLDLNDKTGKQTKSVLERAMEIAEFIGKW